MNSKIIRPRGPIIKRIVIEGDVNGQANVNATNPSLLDPLTQQPQPLHVLDTLAVILQTASLLVQLYVQSEIVGKREGVKGNGQEPAR